MNEVQYIIEEECNCSDDDIIILGPDDHGLKEIDGVKCSEGEPFYEKDDPLEERKALGENEEEFVEQLDASSSDDEITSDGEDQMEDYRTSASEQNEYIGSDDANSIDPAPTVESDESSNSAQLKIDYDGASDISEIGDKKNAAEASENEEFLEDEEEIHCGESNTDLYESDKEAGTSMKSDNEDDDIIEIIEESSSGQSEINDEEAISTDGFSSEIDEESEAKGDVLSDDEFSASEQSKEIDSTIQDRDSDTSPTEDAVKGADENRDEGFVGPELDALPSEPNEPEVKELMNTLIGINAPAAKTFVEDVEEKKDFQTKSDLDLSQNEEAEEKEQSKVENDISVVEATSDVSDGTIDIDLPKPEGDISRNKEAEEKEQSNIDTDISVVEATSDVSDGTIDIDLPKPEADISQNEEVEEKEQSKVGTDISVVEATSDVADGTMDVDLPKPEEDISQKKETNHNEDSKVVAEVSAVEATVVMEDEVTDADLAKPGADLSQKDDADYEEESNVDVNVPPTLEATADMAHDTVHIDLPKSSDDISRKEHELDVAKPSFAEESIKKICNDLVDDVALTISPRKISRIELLSSSDEDDVDKSSKNEAVSPSVAVKVTSISQQQQVVDSSSSLLDPIPNDSNISLEGTATLAVGKEDEKLEDLGDDTDMMVKDEPTSLSETRDIEMKETREAVIDVASGKQDVVIQKDEDAVARKDDERKEVSPEVASTDENGIDDGNLGGKLDNSPETLELDSNINIAVSKASEEKCNTIEVGDNSDGNGENKMGLSLNKGVTAANSDKGDGKSDVKEDADAQDSKEDEYSDDHSLSSRSSMGSAAQFTRHSPRISTTPRRAKSASLEKLLATLPPVKEDEVASVGEMVEISVSKPAPRRSKRKTSGGSSMSSAAEESSKSQSLRKSTRKRTPASSVASDDFVTEVPTRKSRKRADSISSAASTQSVRTRSSARVRNREKTTGEEEASLSQGQSSPVSISTAGRKTMHKKAKATVDDKTISSEMTPVSVSRSTRSSARKAANIQATPASSVASAGERSRTRGTKSLKKAEKPTPKSPPRRSRRLRAKN